MLEQVTTVSVELLDPELLPLPELPDPLSGVELSFTTTVHAFVERRIKRRSLSIGELLMAIAFSFLVNL